MSFHGPQMPMERYSYIFLSNNLPTAFNPSSVLFNFLMSVFTFSGESNSSNT